jgi:hypothetical protein
MKKNTIDMWKFLCKWSKRVTHTLQMLVCACSLAILVVPHSALSQGGVMSVDLIEGSLSVTGGSLTFSSLNPNIDVNVPQSKMAHLKVADLFTLASNDEAEGLFGTILGEELIPGEGQFPEYFPEAEGSEVDGIFFKVYLYDSEIGDGKGDPLYIVYLTQTSTEVYLSNPLRTAWDNVILGHPEFTNDVKRAVTLALDDMLDQPSENLNNPFPKYLFKMSLPVVIEVTIQNATLEKFKVPGMPEHFGSFFKLEDSRRVFYNPTGYPNYVTFAAHRGYTRKYPENTLEAIRESMKYNPDQIEIDMVKTIDDVIVGTHTELLGHYASGNDMDDLSQYYYGEVETHIFPIDKFGRVWDGTAGTTQIELPLLEEFFELCKDRVMMHMDVRGAPNDYYPLILDLAYAHGVENQLIFKGRWMPDELVAKFGSEGTNSGDYGDLFSLIDYLVVAFPDNKDGYIEDLGLGEGATWVNIVDAFANDPRIGSSIRGFEMQWFSDFNAPDIEMRDVGIPYIKESNMIVLSSPMWPESWHGNWDPPKNAWRRFSPYTDRRSDWDFWFDMSADTPKAMPNIIIADNVVRLLQYLEERGLRSMDD